MTGEPETLTPETVVADPASDAPRLVMPRLEATLADGRVLTVQVLNADLVRLDRTAARHKWPPPTTAPFLSQTFLAWSALRRTAQLAEDVTWETFERELAVQVRDAPSLNGTGPAAEEVVPFRSDLAPE